MPSGPTATSASFPEAQPVDLAEHYRRVRTRSCDLVATLQPEDTVVQSMPEVSPSKWHLAHTSWFFEQFVLGRSEHYQPISAHWAFLFNSYYDAVGPRHGRAQRGLLSRPTLTEILEYREFIDARMAQLLSHGDADETVFGIVMLGLQHEQQHQELMLADIKHVFSVNPMEPVFRMPQRVRAPSKASSQSFTAGEEGIVEIGYGGGGFCFDNETPRHRVLLYPHALARRPVSNAEYREFMRAGGYRTPSLWLSDGWSCVQRHGWQGPLYWDARAETEFTLCGRQEIDPHAPVCHVSFFEADAYARWAGRRLPTEQEWEHAATRQGSMASASEGNFADSGHFQPQPSPGGEGWAQLFGDVWEWTASPYVGYPGYRAPAGALGEYNGKFMSGQWVLRGGSCATPAGHVRPSYRNFFYPADRWQFSGLRLATDL